VLVDLRLMSRGVMGKVKMIKDDRLCHDFVDLNHHLSLPEYSLLLLYGLAHRLVLRTWSSHFDIERGLRNSASTYSFIICQHFHHLVVSPQT